MENVATFFVLEFWFDVKSFRSTFDAAKSKPLAQYIVRRYLVRSAEKEIYPPQSAQYADYEKLVEELSSVVESDYLTKSLFNNLMLFFSTVVSLGSYNARFAATGKSLLSSSTSSDSTKSPPPEKGLRSDATKSPPPERIHDRSLSFLGSNEVPKNCIIIYFSEKEKKTVAVKPQMHAKPVNQLVDETAQKSFIQVIENYQVICDSRLINGNIANAPCSDYLGTVIRVVQSASSVTPQTLSGMQSQSTASNAAPPSSLLVPSASHAGSTSNLSTSSSGPNSTKGRSMSDVTNFPAVPVAPSSSSPSSSLLQRDPSGFSSDLSTNQPLRKAHSVVSERARLSSSTNARRRPGGVFKRADSDKDKEDNFKDKDKERKENLPSASMQIISGILATGTRDETKKNPITLPRLQGRKFNKENEGAMIQEPFKRMLKVTILGSSVNVNAIMGLFKQEDSFASVSDCLLKLNPVPYTPHLRFFSKLVLSNPGLIIFTTFSDVAKYKFLEGFSKTYFLLVDLSYGKDLPTDSQKKSKNYKLLSFSKSLSNLERRDQLMSAIEVIIKSKRNTFRTLNYEFPKYTRDYLTNMMRMVHLNINNKIVTESKIYDNLLVSLCSVDTLEQFEAVGVEEAIYIILFIYKDDSVVQNKKLLPRKEVQAENRTIEDLLRINFKIKDKKDEELPDFDIFDHKLDQLQLSSPVFQCIGGLHIIYKFKAGFQTFIQVMQQCGLFLPVLPYNANSVLPATTQSNAHSSPNAHSNASGTTGRAKERNERELESTERTYLLDIDLLHTLALAIADEAFSQGVQPSQMHFAHERLGPILSAFSEEHAMSQLKCTKDPQSLLLNLLQTYYFVILDNRILKRSYYIPVLSIFHTGKVTVFDDKEFKREKRPVTLKRYFFSVTQTPFNYIDRVLYAVYSSLSHIFADVEYDYQVIFANDSAQILLKVRSVTAIIIEGADLNVIVMKYLGTKAELIYFSKFCHLIRCVQRNLFHRVDCQEVVECPFCSEAYPMEDLIQNWLVTREPIVCAIAKQPVPFESLLPEFHLEHNGLRVSPNYKTLPGKLGEGAFGVVNRGVVIEGSLANNEVAVKKFKRAGTEVTWGSYREFNYEAMLANSLENKYILRQIGIDLSDMALVQELAKGGILGDLLHKSTDDISRELKKKMALDLAQGLAYLHSRDPPIIHRDLRSFNVFVMSLASDCEVNVKIGDFGLSLIGYVPSDEPLESWQWLAPEVIDGTSLYNEKSDIYSYGVVIYEIFSRQLPFANVKHLLHTVSSPISANEINTKEKVELLQAQGFDVDQRQGTISKTEFKSMQAKKAICEEGLTPELPFQFQSNLVQLLQSCWERQASDRPTADAIYMDMRSFDVDNLISEDLTFNDYSNSKGQNNRTLPYGLTNNLIKKPASVFQSQQDSIKANRMSKCLLLKRKSSGKLMDNIKHLQKRDSAGMSIELDFYEIKGEEAFYEDYIEVNSPSDYEFSTNLLSSDPEDNALSTAANRPNSSSSARHPVTRGHAGSGNDREAMIFGTSNNSASGNEATARDLQAARARKASENDAAPMMKSMLTQQLEQRKQLEKDMTKQIGATATNPLLVKSVVPIQYQTSLAQPVSVKAPSNPLPTQYQQPDKVNRPAQAIPYQYQFQAQMEGMQKAEDFFKLQQLYTIGMIQTSGTNASPTAPLASTATAPVLATQPKRSDSIGAVQPALMTTGLPRLSPSATATPTAKDETPPSASISLTVNVGPSNVSNQASSNPNSPTNSDFLYSMPIPTISAPPIPILPALPSSPGQTPTPPPNIPSSLPVNMAKMLPVPPSQRRATNGGAQSTLSTSPHVLSTSDSTSPTVSPRERGGTSPHSNSSESEPRTSSELANSGQANRARVFGLK